MGIEYSNQSIVLHDYFESAEGGGRFSYDQRDFYLSLIPFWQRPILLGLIRYLRPFYEDAVSRMDTIITNSENVQSRIQKYLGIDSRVIYPPCETEKFKWLGQEDY